MIKFSVKKPYLTVVSVIIILVIGMVSLSKMKTDLLPEIGMPYLMVITTEPGASPEKVGNDVTKPLESSLGTISGVKNIVSNSAENYSLVMLEFDSGTNMDSAMVKVSEAVNMVELPEISGRPNILEISMDMMATMYATVSYDNKDIVSITEFTEDVVVPYLERQEGVASITEIGAVTQTMEVRLNKDKIDKLNEDIVVYTNDKLKDAKKDIDKAQSKLEKAKDKLSDSGSELSDKQEGTNSEISKALSQLDNAKASKAAYEASLNSMNASKSALEAEKKIYDDNNIAGNYQSINDMFAGFKNTLGQPAKLAGISIPDSVKDAVDNPDKLTAFTSWMTQLGYGEQVSALTPESLQNIYNIVTKRIPEIDSELSNLAVEIKAVEALNNAISSKMEQMDENYEKALSGALSASAGFGQAGAQIESGKTSINDAMKELSEARKQFKDSKKAALDNANLDKLLSIDALSGLIYAQNFAMPAGYIDDKNDNQWLLKVGDEYESPEEIKSMVLVKNDAIGRIKLSDVADVTIVDDSENSYAKYNGNDAILLAIYKASTANTSEVSDNCKEAVAYLENKYPGLKIVSFSDQAKYISIFLESVLYSMLAGAALAIIVLALFLKSVKPTIVVAFSIPFSVLFAIILMYFTGININVMSLAGLALAIGMLVDNSIVVIENIFRLRNNGIAPARAAVQGAKQVAAPIAASTITTICVFLPMVFTEGMVRDLMMPFAFTISYALTASLFVALTVVPTVSSVILKKTVRKKQPLFDRVLKGYRHMLSWCLKYKFVPLIAAVLLLIFSIYEVFKMGIVMVPDMSGDTISVTAEMPEGTDNDTAVEIADGILDSILNVEGVKEVGAMDSMGAVNMVAGGIASGQEAEFSTFMYYIIPDESVNTTDEVNDMLDKIRKATDNAGCEVMVGSQEAATQYMSSGISVNIYGDDTDTLMKISDDVMDIMDDVPGITNITNGLDEGTRAVHLIIDKDKAAKKGLNVAQIYNEISTRLTTDKTASSMTVNNSGIDIKVIDETNPLNYENLMDMEIEATTYDSDGKEVKKTYKLSDFATTEMTESANIISRENQKQYMTVSSEMEEGKNATLVSRELKPLIEKYETPEGYSIEIAGESQDVAEMLDQMILAILLGFLLIYLVMVAQFQSLLSPFIVIFTIPLAFTGGLLGLLIFRQEISALSLMGFMVLMGTVVNNGIVFVDYVNQLRIQGLDKRNALIASGVTRLRPIVMTAITTILAMSNMVFTKDAGSAMAKGMAIVISGGLIYSTFMTLIIVPVMYDILYRRQPKIIDVGDDLEDIPNDAEEYLLSQKNN